jgi:hypothetical protein
MLAHEPIYSMKVLYNVHCVFRDVCLNSAQGLLVYKPIYYEPSGGPRLGRDNINGLVYMRNTTIWPVWWGGGGGRPSCNPP